MANASDYLESKIYNHIFRQIPFALPTTVAIGLTTDTPKDDGSYTEVVGGGYARCPHASGTLKWSAMSNPGSGENIVEFAFPVATADWGTISGIVICDSATPGFGLSNVLMHGILTPPRNILSGDIFCFSSGSISISIQ